MTVARKRQGKLHLRSGDPSVTDDISSRYFLGDIYVNLSSGEAFILTDWTAGAAVWTSITAGGGGGVSDGDKGDITVSGSGATWTIDAGVVTLAKQADLATQRVIGRNTGSTGVPEAVTASQLLDWITTTEGHLLQRGSSAWAGATAGAVVAAAYPPRIVPALGDNLYDWNDLTQVASGGTALTSSTAWAVQHYEERQGVVYDALTAEPVTVAAGAAARVALYSAHATTGLPNALLWYGAEEDWSSGGGAGGVRRVSLFSAGTWTTAGDAYKDGSSRFIPPRGMTAWKVFARNTTGAPQTRTFGSGGGRSLGVISSTSGAAKYLGVSVAYTYASGFPDPYGTPTPFTSGQPVLPLRWV